LKSKPDFADARYLLGRILLAQGAVAEALEHLDFAISEFRDMKMRPWLERALRHKEILKA